MDFEQIKQLGLCYKCLSLIETGFLKNDLDKLIEAGAPTEVLIEKSHELEKKINDSTK